MNLSGASDTSDIFNRAITISTVDANRKSITSSITWQQTPARRPCPGRDISYQLESLWWRRPAELVRRVLRISGRIQYRYVPPKYAAMYNYTRHMNPAVIPSALPIFPATQAMIPVVVHNEKPTTYNTTYANKGFTLIELLLYIGIVGAMICGFCYPPLLMQSRVKNQTFQK